MEPLAILIAIAVIILGNYKNLHLVISTIVASFLYTIIITGSVSFSFVSSYWEGFSSFILQFFGLYFFSALFSTLLEKTHIADRLLLHFGSKLDLKRLLLVIASASFLMIIFGLKPVFIMFTMYPFIERMFAQMNLPRHYMPVCLLGFLAPAQMLPGSAQLQNILPVDYLGLEPFHTPIPGIIGFCITASLVYVYLLYRLKKENVTISLPSEESSLPLKGWAPLAALGAFLLLGINVLDLPVSICLLICCGLLLVLYRLSSSELLDALSKSCCRSRALFFTSALAGFGSVINDGADITRVLSDMGGKVMGNPLLLCFITAVFVSAILSSSNNTISFLLSSLNVARFGTLAPLCSRFIVLGSLTFDTLPQNGVIAMVIRYCDCQYKDSYPDLFVTTVLFPLISGAIVLLIYTLI